MPIDPQSLLRELFASSIDAAHPRRVLAPPPPADRSGRVIVIGAGKAAAAMAEVIEAHWQGEISGLVVTRYEHGANCQKIEVVEAAHPVPDAAGLAVAGGVRARAGALGAGAGLFFLLPGGGPPRPPRPAEGISLQDKQAVNKAL